MTRDGEMGSWEASQGEDTSLGVEESGDQPGL